MNQTLHQARYSRNPGGAVPTTFEVCCGRSAVGEKTDVNPSRLRSGRITVSRQAPIVVAERRSHRQLARECIASSGASRAGRSSANHRRRATLACRVGATYMKKSAVERWLWQSRNTRHSAHCGGAVARAGWIAAGHIQDSHRNHSGTSAGNTSGETSGSTATDCEATP